MSEAEWLFASDAEFTAASDSGPEAQPELLGSAPRAGTRWGPFRVDAELGRGANARVYRVWIGERGPLALKVLINPRPSARQRLAREAQLVGQLQHPGIVQLRGAGECNQKPFLLYELVQDARPLSGAWFALSTSGRVDLVAKVAAAVGYAHGCGVLHRDLKPANVLVGADDEPRVVDFGLATHADVEALTQSGSWVGTPSYMAPEQFESTRSAQTPAVDVWSLGVLLYEALTERLPFHGTTVMQLAAQVMDAPVRPPRKLNGEVSPAVEGVCLRALAKDPAGRYPDGRAFALALRAALGTRAAPPGLRWVALVAVAAALGGAGTAVALLGGDPAPPALDREAPSPFADLSVRDALDRWGPAETRRLARARLELVPDDDKARLALAGSHARVKEWEPAYREARAVLNRRPEHLLALELLAVSAQGLGRIAASQEYCERGLELDPSRYRLWDIKSMLAAYHKDGNEAERAAKRALELAPEHPQILATYALALSLQGKEVEAVEYYDRSLAIEDSPDVRFNRALSLMNLKRADAALADAELVLRQHPDDPGALCLRASILTLSDLEGAAGAARELQRRFPNNARVQHTAGEIFRLNKQHEPAREAYLRSLEIDPNGQFAADCRKELVRLKGR